MRRSSRSFLETAGRFVPAISTCKVNILSAITATALGAAVVMVLPGFSPSVEAGTTSPAIQAIQADVRDNVPLDHDCAQQTWPYYAPDCLRRTQAAGEPKAVRLISIDRLPK